LWKFPIDISNAPIKSSLYGGPNYVFPFLVGYLWKILQGPEKRGLLWKFVYK